MCLYLYLVLFDPIISNNSLFDIMGFTHTDRLLVTNTLFCFVHSTTNPQIPAHKFRSSAIVLRLENMGLFYKRDLC